MADFYERTGKMALGSRLRRLSDQITEQAASIYKLYLVDLHPKWFPVFYALSRGEEKSIMDIAREIGHSHPSVSQIVREMLAKGIVTGTKGDGARGGGADEGANSAGNGRVDSGGRKAGADGRKNFVVLSAEGRALWEKMQPQLIDVQAAIEGTMKETEHDLWRAIGEWEFLLEQKSLLRRVQEEKKSRESHQVQIVGYSPAHSTAFKQLNEEWITKYFKMEASDYKSLDHPEENILDKGGYIFMAILDGQAIGTCALIRMNPAVAPHPAAPHASPISARIQASDATQTTETAQGSNGAQASARNPHIDNILSAYPGQGMGSDPSQSSSDPAQHAVSHPADLSTLAAPGQPAPPLTFEMAKMGVSPLAQGKGIGFLLGQACIEKARELGAEKIYLESNTRLKPAISLYHKLGFRKVAGPPSPYERCDIQMELKL